MQSDSEFGVLVLLTVSAIFAYKMNSLTSCICFVLLYFHLDYTQVLDVFRPSSRILTLHLKEFFVTELKI